MGVDRFRVDPTYRRIAESMDVTEQVVYKIMREARAAHEIKESA